MNSAIAAAVLGLISADPTQDEPTWIYDNQISMVFNQTITSQTVVVTDGEGCTVSQYGEVVGNGDKLVVHMKACKVSGYPGGHMTVKYRVNGTDGEYHLHVRHHH